MSTKQSESVPVAVTAPQVEAKAAPCAVTAPQVETKAAPAADTTQQPTTLTATMQRVKNPKRVAAGKMVAERNRLAWEEQKKAAEAYYAEKQAKPATAAPKPASAPTNGSLWAALAFPFSGSITSVKSSWQWPSPFSTNSKRRSPRRRSPWLSSVNLLARHAHEYLKKCFERLCVIYITMPSLAQLLIHTAAIEGIMLFWADFTVKSWRMVRHLTDKMLVKEGERQRKMGQEVRRKIEIEDKIKEFAEEEAERQGPN